MKWKSTVAWEPIDVPSRNRPWAERLQGIIHDLDVTFALRYAAEPATKCNIYCTDIIRNMGFAEPCHWMTADGKPARVGRGIEMSANRLAAWFRKHGAAHGWVRADEGSAHDSATRGHLTVAIWQSDGRRGPGHCAIVLPREVDTDKPEVMWITQAGKHNFRRCTLRMGFGDKTPEFWVQCRREGPPHER